ncbi:unnamed protein product, partial [Polarella glacialis]
DMPIKICHLGQAAVAAAASLILGALVVSLGGSPSPSSSPAAVAAAAAAAASICAGPQSLLQLACQALGAGAGATVMDGIDAPWSSDASRQSQRARPEPGYF